MTSNCYLCGKNNSSILEKVDKKPVGETDYGITQDDYYREICECHHCGVYFNKHDNLIPDDFYQGQYNDAIVQGNLERRYHKIIQFPYTQSDNKNRVLRIVEYLYKQDKAPAKMKVLDVGSGTGVFLHELNKFGFKVHCLDPDKASTKHALNTIGVEGAFTGPIEDYPIGQQFDLITFNKVLEHVTNPIEILKYTQKLLAPDGILYVELPDGSIPKKENNLINRSEFFLDHYTTFNKKAFKYLIESAGFQINQIQQIVDPSGKYTILGFATLIHL